MPYRQVHGTICDPFGRGMITDVSFELKDDQGSFTQTIQFPGEKTIVRTDNNGEFTTPLWTNTEGLRSSTYFCKFERVCFSFDLPTGTDQIELSVLREQSLTNEASNNTDNNSGSIGIPGTTGSEVVASAGVSNFQTFPISRGGQTIFVLANNPANPLLVQMFINGIKVNSPSEMILNGNIITWLNSYRLETQDLIEVYY